uniref:Ig-like domain-containing protein n=1 Tax=Amphilophus citrinellus TaxID=61819 RepID=A0A3Q0SWP8_AMPCI
PGEKRRGESQPVTFKQKLESQQAEEGADIILRCELSKAGVPVEWKKGTQVLKSGEKYQMKQKAPVNELVINKLIMEDSGEYTCDTGDQKSTATLTLKGNGPSSSKTKHLFFQMKIHWHLCHHHHHHHHSSNIVSFLFGRNSKIHMETFS